MQNHPLSFRVKVCSKVNRIYYIVVHSIKFHVITFKHFHQTTRTGSKTKASLNLFPLNAYLLHKELGIQ